MPQVANLTAPQFLAALQLGAGENAFVTVKELNDFKSQVMGAIANLPDTGSLLSSELESTQRVLSNKIEEVSTIVQSKLYWITVEQFNILDDNAKQQNTHWFIADLASNLVELLNKPLHQNIVGLSPTNGTTLRLNTDQLSKLIDANASAGYYLFSGPIILEGTLETIYGSGYLSLAEIDKYLFFDDPGEAGQISFQNISVSKAIVLLGATNGKKYSYTLQDTADNLTFKSVNTVNVLSLAENINIIGTPPSETQLAAINAVKKTNASVTKID